MEYKYSVEQICKIVNEIAFDDRNNYCIKTPKENCYLARLIAYFNGKYSLLAYKFIYANDETLGLKKEFAKKLPVLVEIFNKYCKIEERYDHDGKTGYYDIDGNVPEILADIIVKEYEKNKIEDEKYIKYCREKARNEKELKNKDVKKLYEKLMD